MQEFYIPALAGLGALILLVAWLPLVIAKAPVSLPIICVAIGAAVFALPGVPLRIDPRADPELAERLTELLVLIALMGAGLKLDRALGWRSWNITWRLLGLAMPLSIAAITAIGHYALALPLASALLLGAALAPTDPVLASDVQVGPPRSGREDEVRFALTSEAGLNDGLAFPFLNLALVLALATAAAAPPDLARWALEDIAWKLAAGAGVGWATGRALGYAMFRLPRRASLSATTDGFVALGATLLAYGLTELAHGYGFLAVFVAAVGIRAAARGHAYHDTLHEFIDQAERLLTMVALLLFGGALAQGLLDGLTLAEVAVTVAVLTLVRPLATFAALAGSGRPAIERRLLAFFGIRGMGTIYYLAHAQGEATFAGFDSVWRVAALVILFSTIVHGVTATSLMRGLDRRIEATRRLRAARKLMADTARDRGLAIRRHRLKKAIPSP